MSNLVGALICGIFHEKRSGCGMIRCCVQNLLIYILTYLLALYLLTRCTLESYPAGVRAQNPGSCDVMHEVSK